MHKVNAFVHVHTLTKNNKCSKSIVHLAYINLTQFVFVCFCIH